MLSGLDGVENKRAFRFLCDTRPLSLVLAACLCFVAQLSWAQQMPQLWQPGHGGHGRDSRLVQPFPFSSNRSEETRERESLYVSNRWLEGILPNVRNLEIGYLYNFGQGFHRGVLVVDYFLPVMLAKGSVFFGEIHSRMEDFPGFLTGSERGNGLVLVGIGYRRRMFERFMLGVNGFCNRTRIAGRWYRSGIAGMEFSMLTFGGGLVSVNTNVYADFFGHRGGFFDLVRRVADYRVEATYLQPLVINWIDVRVKYNQYFLHSGFDLERGWAASGEVLGKNGMFRALYEHGFDRINSSWNRVGIYVSVGFDPTRLISGGNPFFAP